MPLAIELAAGCRTLPLRDIAGQVEQGLDLWRRTCRMCPAPPQHDGSFRSLVAVARRRSDAF
jgi:hypothetical protein